MSPTKPDDPDVVLPDNPDVAALVAELLAKLAPTKPDTADVAALLAKLAEPAAYTIPGFCRAHNYSPPTYYKMKAAGLGPAEIRFGNCIRISREAAAAWRAAREKPTGAEAEEVARHAAAMRERSNRAVAAAVASPQHISAKRRGEG